MKPASKLFPILIICFILMGCTKHVSPEKFELDYGTMRPMKGGAPIQVLVPQNADPNFRLGSPGFLAATAGFSPIPTTNVIVDLNYVYSNAKDLIEDVLTSSKVPISPGSAKSLKFKINSMRWDGWAGGHMTVVYLDFDIETGEGYKRTYTVQDMSGVDVARAVGGSVSRAVERIFQDTQIVEYVQLQ